MGHKRHSFFWAAALVSLVAISLAASPFDPAARLDEKGAASVAKEVTPNVVKVEARNAMRKVATGIIMDKDGYIVTTALISGREDSISVITADGKRVKADFVGLDSQTRLAVLKAKERFPTAISLGRSEGLEPGAWIAVVSLSPENTLAVSQGIVSSVAPDWLRLNVWIVRGTSGSPVVDKDGRMVGLLRGAYFEDNPVLFEFRERQVVGSGYAFSRAQAPSSGMAQAVPVEVVKDVYNQIKAKGKVERGWLGVTVQENEDGRPEIREIEPDSPAALAKLREGDVILKLDGKDVTGPEVLTSEIRMRKPGKDVTLQIDRDGKTMEVKVKLGEYSEEDARLEIERAFPRLFRVPERTPGTPQPFVVPRAPAPERPLTPRPLWEKRKYVGLYLQETTKELSEFFGLKDGVGLLVTQFSDDSPAKKAGLKVGDVIFKADGKRVQTVGELSGILQNKKKGDKIKIEFMRDKKPLSVEVEVGEEESAGLLSQYFNGPEGPKGYEGLFRQFDESGLKKLKEMQSDYLDALRKQIDQAKDPDLIRQLLRRSYSGNMYRI